MASSKTKGTQAPAQQGSAAQAQGGAQKGGPKAAPAHAAGKGKANASATKPSKKGSKKGAKPGLIARAKAYFKSVGVEMRRVVWPTKQEMVKYTGAVVGMLIFFGIIIALVDAAIVPILYAFSGLR